MHIKDVMKTAKTIASDITLEETSEIMNEHHISSLIFMKKDVIAGIVTEQDIIGNYGKQIRISAIVQKPVITIRSDATIEEAAMQMEQNHISVLPVVDKNKLVGIVSANDLLPALRKGGNEFIFD